MNLRGAILTTWKTSNCMKQQNSFGGHNGIKNIHKTAQLKYLAAKPLTLLSSSQAVINEIAQFIPHRTRDNNSPVMVSQTTNRIVPVFQIQSTESFNRRLGCYDCTDAMQSNVSNPFSSKGKLVPGGQWEHQTKFFLNDLQKSHYGKKRSTRMLHTLTHRIYTTDLILHRSESTKASPEKQPVLSVKDKIKRAVAEYGSTVIVFHVGISIISLGTCYVLVSSGIDMGKLLIPLGLSGSVALNAGTFVTAYAIHKVFAPVRISITLASTPFIVRYLRRIGFLKKPKVQ